MDLIEGMATIVMKKDSMDKHQKKEEMNLLLVLFIMKLIFIAIVAYFLWPRIIPQIFPSVKANPGFVNIFGLSIIFSLLR